MQMQDFSQGTVKYSNFVFFFNIKVSQYNALNEKLSNSQLHNSKSGIKSGTEATFKISWNVFGDSNDEKNFSHN